MADYGRQTKTDGIVKKQPAIRNEAKRAHSFPADLESTEQLTYPRRSPNAWVAPCQFVRFPIGDQATLFLYLSFSAVFCL